MDITAAINRDFLARHTRILCTSYQHWTGLRLIDAAADSAEAVQQLLNAPYAVASHDVQPDPVFNYANKPALELFGMGWEEFTRLPSRYSAEPVARAARVQLLQRVAHDGYVDDYSGVRIAKNGRRFMIDNALVWNLMDETGVRCGQAVIIRQWSAL